MSDVEEGAGVHVVGAAPLIEVIIPPVIMGSLVIGPLIIGPLIIGPGARVVVELWAAGEG